MGFEDCELQAARAAAGGTCRQRVLPPYTVYGFEIYTYCALTRVCGVATGVTLSLTPANVERVLTVCCNNVIVKAVDGADGFTGHNCTVTNSQNARTRHSQSHSLTRSDVELGRTLTPLYTPTHGNTVNFTFHSGVDMHHSHTRQPRSDAVNRMYSMYPHAPAQLCQ